jgi:uncharacterized membrane protein YqjE
MSMPPPDPVPQARPAPQGGNQGAAHGCLAAFFALLGVIMVLPGLCSFVVLLTAIGQDWRTNIQIAPLWIITFVVAAGGIWLVRHALRMERAAREARKAAEANQARDEETR